MRQVSGVTLYLNKQCDGLENLTIDYNFDILRQTSKEKYFISKIGALDLEALKGCEDGRQCGFNVGYIIPILNKSDNLSGNYVVKTFYL